MKAKLKAPYTGPEGRFEAGRTVSDSQIPADQIKAMISAGLAEPVGTVEVQRPQVAERETADIKHVGGGWYDRGDDGPNVRKSELTPKEVAALSG